MATIDASITFRIPSDVLASFVSAYGKRGLGARLRYLVERDLRERDRKRGYSPLRDPVTGSVAGLVDVADALGDKLGSDPIDPAAGDPP